MTGLTHKKILLLFWIASVCVLIIHIATASGVIVTSYEIQPQVLIPGDTGIVSATLTNTGPDYPSDLLVNGNISHQMDGSSAAIIDSVFLDGKKNIEVIQGNSQFEGSLGIGQSITISFLIRAPPMSGIFFPELLIRIRNHESMKFPILVNVNTAVSAIKQPALMVHYSVQNLIRSGTDVPVGIEVTNKGRSSADEVIIRITDKDPAIAARSQSSRYIAHLKPDESSLFTLNLTIDKNAPSGIHKIPLDIQYTTTNGMEEILTDTITLDIRGESGISIASLSTDPVRLTERLPFDLMIRLENIGTSDARSVRASISLPFAGTREAFVGTIEPGNDAPAVFVLTSGDPGEYPYTLDVQYEDDWGEHKISDILTITITAKESELPVVIVVIVLVLIVAIGYRIYSRRGA